MLTPGEITLSGDLDHDLVRAFFLRAMFAERLTAIRTASWSTDVTHPTLPDAVEILHLRDDDNGRDVHVVSFHGRPVELDVAGGRVSVRIAHSANDDVEALFRDLKTFLPPSEPTDIQTVPVTFWSAADNRPRAIVRKLQVPCWDETRHNYSTGTRKRLEELLQYATPGQQGQLILWSGPPGTGKTYALRTLAWEWRAWCRLHYITDPETFLGANAHYLLHVLLDTDSDGEDDDTRDTPRWRLLVLEDTGELLTPDARERAGQGLSRLLNVVDGLIGQGVQILVLLTTNEEIGRLHPAVSRAGRCAFRHEFDRLSSDEAQAWLARHGATLPGVGTRTLAELYAITRGTDRPREERPIGFGPR